MSCGHSNVTSSIFCLTTFPWIKKCYYKLIFFKLNFTRYKGSIFEIKLINNVHLNKNAIAYDNFKCYKILLFTLVIQSVPNCKVNYW